MAVLIWPENWYRFASSSFTLRSVNFAAAHTWTGGRSVNGPFAQLWMADFVMASQAWDDRGQEIAAFFSRLAGQAGKFRIADPLRRRPLRDRRLAPTSETFSDATQFSDGTGFVSGYLPDFVTLDLAAVKSATSIVLRGLPASEPAVLRRGDLIELRPSGVPSETPNLYEVQFNAPTDASGKTRVGLAPSLRQGFAAGDMAVLRDPTSVFRVKDDEQGRAERDVASIAAIGFSVIEAIV